VGVPKLGNYFLLSMFVDFSLVYFRSGVVLGIWKL
jgi:hypothetical protein